MAQIAGLRGVLPDPSKVKEVVAGAGPGFDAAKRLASGSLVRDAGRAVYRYHQAFADPANARMLVRKMFLCAVRLEPWTEGLVRPHEESSPAQTAARLTALRASKMQTAPVLAGYRDAALEVDRLFRRVDGDRPTLEVTTPDHTVHRLWRVQSAEVFGQLRHVFAPKKLNVLDGHDLYEALLAYRDELGAKRPLAMYSSANHGVMCLVNLHDPTLLVTLRPRVIRGAPSSQEVLASARRYFIIDKLAGAAKDPAKQRAALADTIAHQPALVISWSGEPDAWKLTLSPDVSPVNEGIQVERALQKLDPIVTDRLFIERAMPGAKVETPATLEEALAAKPDAKPDAVVIMRPLSVEQVMHVSDTGHVLPTGSTLFYPPLAPGLLSSVVEPDEDLV
jgi:uncharacterized protein (DUF1015 family)